MLGAVLLCLCAITASKAEVKKSEPNVSSLSFFTTRKLTPQLLQLYREAMSEAGLNMEGTKLQVIREKVVNKVSYFKVYFTNQAQMNCYILFKVVMFEGVRIKSYVCVNDQSEVNGVEDIYHHYTMQPRKKRQEDKK